MHYTIYELIQQAQKGSADSLIELIDRFKPLIKKYAHKSFYKEDMESILMIQLIQSIKTMNAKSEASSVSFIQTVIRNKFFNEIKKEYQCTQHEVADLELCVEGGLNDQYTLEFKDMLKPLDSRKKKIIYLKFALGYSDREISYLLHISRQAVNKHLRKSYECLRTSYAKIRD